MLVRWITGIFVVFFITKRNAQQTGLQKVTRCSGKEFNNLMCPFTLVTNISRVYVGLHQSVTCSSDVTDCIQVIDDVTHADLYNDVISKCHLLTACMTSLYTSSVMLNCLEPINSNYEVIEYNCVPPPLGRVRYMARCLGARFEQPLCPFGELASVYQSYLGVTQRVTCTPQSDDCVHVSNHVVDDDVRAKCDGRMACRDLRVTSGNAHACTDRPDNSWGYVVVQHTCQPIPGLEHVRWLISQSSNTTSTLCYSGTSISVMDAYYVRRHHSTPVNGPISLTDYVTPYDDVMVLAEACNNRSACAQIDIRPSTLWQEGIMVDAEYLEMHFVCSSKRQADPAMEPGFEDTSTQDTTDTDNTFDVTKEMLTIVVPVIMLLLTVSVTVVVVVICLKQRNKSSVPSSIVQSPEPARPGNDVIYGRPTAVVAAMKHSVVMDPTGLINDNHSNGNTHQNGNTDNPGKGTNGRNNNIPRNVKSLRIKMEDDKISDIMDRGGVLSDSVDDNLDDDLLLHENPNYVRLSEAGYKFEMFPSRSLDNVIINDVSSDEDVLSDYYSDIRQGETVQAMFVVNEDGGSDDGYSRVKEINMENNSPRTLSHGENYKSILVNEQKDRSIMATEEQDTPILVNGNKSLSMLANEKQDDSIFANGKTDQSLSINGGYDRIDTYADPLPTDDTVIVDNDLYEELPD